MAPNHTAAPSRRADVYCSRIPLKWAPLSLALAGLSLFALSNQIGLGPYNFHFNYDFFGLGPVFRSSGRFFWPVFYVLMFWVLLRLHQRLGPQKAALLLAPCLLIQVVDTSAGWTKNWRRLHKYGDEWTQWTAVLKSPFWEITGVCYNKIRILPPTRYHPNFADFGYLAARHGMATDLVYLARVDDTSLLWAWKQASWVAQTGHWEADAIYILVSPELSQRIPADAIDQSDAVGMVDGFYVIAPRWRKSACVREQLQALPPGTSVEPTPFELEPLQTESAPPAPT